MTALINPGFRPDVRKLITQPLTFQQVDQAFPLVQICLPELELGAWRDFAHKHLRAADTGSGGILCVVAERNLIAGLGIYRFEAILHHGPALIADHFMALDPFDLQSVASALAEFLETLGRRSGCKALHISIPKRAGPQAGPGISLASVLQERGLAVESLLLCKALDGTAASAQGPLMG